MAFPQPTSPGTEWSILLRESVHMYSHPGRSGVGWSFLWRQEGSCTGVAHVGAPRSSQYCACLLVALEQLLYQQYVLASTVLRASILSFLISTESCEHFRSLNRKNGKGG
jgi:hypothetical protein